MRRVLFLLLIILLAGCNFESQDATPTVEGVFEEPIDPLPELTETPSRTPTFTPPAVVQVITLPPTATPEPSITPTPEPTLGPWEYVIKENETLGFIIQQSPFNYPFDLAVINEIVRINENIPNADVLPPPGSTILIPRPTQVPMVLDVGGTPEEGERRVSSAVIGEIGCHEVREGEGLVGIAEQYGITLEIISQLNPDINFFGCNFENPSGGPDCSPIIVAGTCVNVPFPTATPTLTITPSGSETPTATPTLRPPGLLSPPDGSIVSGPVTLYWDSVGLLQPDEYYLVQVTDSTSGETWSTVTRTTAVRVDDSLIPTDGQTHDVQWQVSIAKQTADGSYTPIGTPSTIRTFRWQ